MGLIQLISKHQLYISESGLIARYGKTKSAAESSTTQNRGRHFRQDTKEFVYGSMNSLVWILLYVALNLLLFAIGVGVYSRREELKDSWRLWAFGTGPVLSMNCVLILLPTLSSLVHAMRGSIWMAKVRECVCKLCCKVIITRQLGIFCTMQGAWHAVLRPTVVHFYIGALFCSLCFLQ